jgi:glucarate dehydratase
MTQLPSPGDTPRITAIHVIPVAGQDSMMLNLSGAHAPWFIRDLVLLEDNSGHTRVGEVPGGESIRQVLEEARNLVVGADTGDMQRILESIQSQHP